eukprot:s3453_g12.t1
MAKVLHWGADQVGFHQREIGFIDARGTERHELRQFRVLQTLMMQNLEKNTSEKSKVAWQGLSSWTGAKGRHGFSEIDRMNAYDLSDGKSTEEEDMKVDEEENTLLPVAAWSERHGFTVFNDIFTRPIQVTNYEEVLQRSREVLEGLTYRRIPDCFGGGDTVDAICNCNGEVDFNFEGWNFLQLAISNKMWCHLEQVNLLQNFGASVTKKSPYGTAPLIFACER